MAQKNVQLIIGQILTDEEFRSDFLERPMETLAALRERGVELTRVEIEQVARRLLRDDERVAVRARHHVHKGEGILVIVDAVRGQLAASPDRFIPDKKTPDNRCQG